MECCCIDVDPKGMLCPSEIQTRVARKEHSCTECHAAIKPGERYEYVRGLYDGSWDTYKTCWFCLAIRRDFFDCGWYYGNLVHDFAECNGWDYRTVPEE